MKKTTIVGYDPGTTAAVGVIDTNGKVLFVSSKKSWKREEIIKEISDIGIPIIISTDRNPVPKSVEKMSHSLGTKCFYPIESLSIVEKWSLIKKTKVKNDHERDALAAALKAYEKYSNLFKKTDKVLSSLYLNELYDKVLKILLLGKAENITNAVEIAMKELRKKEKLEKGIKKISKPKDFSDLKNKLKQKEEDIKILKKYNQSLKEKLEKSDIDIKRLDFHEIKNLRKEIYNLKEELEKKNEIISKLKLFNKLEGKYIPILKVKDDISVIEKVDKNFSLRDRIITINPEKIELLNDYKIKAAIVDKIDEKILKKVNFPVLLKSDITIKNINNLSVVEKDEFENKIKKARKIGFVKWLKNYKKRKS